METTRAIANLFEGIYILGKREYLPIFYGDVYVERDSKHYPIESYLEMLRNGVCVSVGNKCQACPLYEEICYGKFIEYAKRRITSNKKPENFPLIAFMDSVKYRGGSLKKRIKHIQVAATHFRNKTLTFADPYLYETGKKSFAGMTPEEVRREAAKLKNK